MQLAATRRLSQNSSYISAKSLVWCLFHIYVIRHFGYGHGFLNVLELLVF